MGRTKCYAVNNNKYVDRSDKRRTIFIGGLEKNSQGC